MACFTPALVAYFLVWLVIAIAAIAIFNLVVPWALSKLEAPPDSSIVVRLLQIIIWAFVIIVVIYFTVDLISCLGGLRIRP